MMRSMLMVPLLVLTLSACKATPSSEDLRPPAVAGQFYPAEASRLEAAIKNFLNDALPSHGERPIALVLPHAGYVFSGQIAADGWKQAQGLDYDTVVILAPDHTVEPFRGVSISRVKGYRTPLGVAAVDLPLAEILARTSPEVCWRREAHAQEHAEEVQVPFVQALFPKARILPCVFGTADPDLARRFGLALAAALKGRKALVVASSDLSHYPTQERAEIADRATLTAMAGLDSREFQDSILRTQRQGGLDTAACGQGPILAAMEAARALGATRGTVVSYANSGGTVHGETSRVVGYGSVMFTAGSLGRDIQALAAPAASEGRTLNATEGRELLALARRTLERHLLTGIPPLPRPASTELRRKAGAFVTLNRDGALRGCIGHMVGDAPLALTVARMAIEAGTGDPRFRPVTPAELSGLTLEVSVLSPARPVHGVGDITPGRDGVVIEKDGRGAVFLPQVATEQGWGREELLDNLCLKAGLPKNAWRSGARFLTFQAEVFAEPRHR
jgi:MEMO1 family protein